MSIARSVAGIRLRRPFRHPSPPLHGGSLVRTNVGRAFSACAGFTDRSVEEFCLVGAFFFGFNWDSPEGKRMVSGLTRNQVLRKELRVRIPCPPLTNVAVDVNR